MPYFDAAAVANALPWEPLIEAIERTLTNPSATAPERTIHTVDTAADGRPASLLLKPGWVVGDAIVVKAVTFFPDNGLRNLPTVNAGVLIFDGTTGLLRAACDGNELTTRRTAAASAVAAKRLARTDVRRLLVVGSGALSPMIAQAHAAVRDFEVIEIWGRDPSKAAVVVAELAEGGVVSEVSDDLDDSVARADVISCVTGSTTPLVRGSLLGPGTHVDLVGSFTPDMREADDDVIRRGSVWVDTFADGVIAGDLSQPLADGVIEIGDLKGDLAGLVSGRAQGRVDDHEVTVFKSAGMALEDVAAARLVVASGGDECA